MLLDIKKLGFVAAFSLLASTISAAENPIKSDLSALVTYSMSYQKVFDNNPWDIDFSRPRSIVSYLAGKLTYVDYSKVPPAVCYNAKSSKLDDLIVKGTRASACQSETLSLYPINREDLDISADKDGFISVVRGKQLIEEAGFDGGYVINQYQYTPFEATDTGIYWYSGGVIPSQLSSGEAQTLYRVAHYLGDSMLKDSDLRLCESVVSSMNFVCDGRSDSVFALKGVALLSFAASCATCEGAEKAFLAGKGISYLLSIPRGSYYFSVGIRAYTDLKRKLLEAGYDVSEIERKKVYSLIN